MKFFWAALAVVLLSACGSAATSASTSATQSPSPSHCAKDYSEPADWNTKQVVSKTPGIANYVEPLNVVISGCTNVSLSTLQSALDSWDTVYTSSSILHGVHIACISTEQANVAGKGYVTEEHSWRYKGCAGGNLLSLSGKEAHVRLWNQPVSGSQYGAWFVTASYETACVSVGGKLYPVSGKGSHKVTKGSSVFHCIDGGPGSDGTDGYDRAAKDFAGDIVTAAHKKGWKVTQKTVTRPTSGSPTVGEDGAKFTGTVYVLTVTA